MTPDEDRRKFSEGGPGLPLGAFLAGPFAFFGRSAILWINSSGAAVIFFLLAFQKIFRPKQLSKIVQQVYYI
ncbi:MAG TPA: ABC transporter permease, partial [Nitrospirota bacterium]|nr:ABC transporter permease [Nitrospirota bacterium]